MALYLLRGAFVLLATSVMLLYLLPSQSKLEMGLWGMVGMIGTTLGVCLAVIALDAFTGQRKILALSGMFLGLLAGLVAAYASSFMIDLLGLLFAPREAAGGARSAFLDILEGAKVFIGLVTCYLGISIVMQTKDEFRFVVPYVEFAKEYRGVRPTFVDTSALIDGRIEDLARTHVLPQPLVVPRFVINELQGVADNKEKLRRDRGRRGFDVLRKLQESPEVEVSVDDAEPPAATVDQRLIRLAQESHGRVLTCDANLARAAAVLALPVINLHDVAKALQPKVLPGESLTVKLTGPGESGTQAVGYLEDGTMVVAENGEPWMGRRVELTITSSLQTAHGRMFFGRVPRDQPMPE
jgi:uncharacterized protein YacL